MYSLCTNILKYTLPLFYLSNALRFKIILFLIRISYSVFLGREVVFIFFSLIVFFHLKINVFLNDSLHWNNY